MGRGRFQVLESIGCIRFVGLAIGDPGYWIESRCQEGGSDEIG